MHKHKWIKYVATYVHQKNEKLSFSYEEVFVALTATYTIYMTSVTTYPKAGKCSFGTTGELYDEILVKCING